MMKMRLSTSLGFEGLRAFFLLLVAFFVAAPLCAQETKPPELPLLFDSRERLPKPDLSSLVRLRFLTTVDFPPFNFTDQDGRLAGFHVELVRQICSELGILEKCQIQAMPFADLEQALADGQAEAVVAGVGVTAELRKRFGFSRPYMLLPARFARNLKAPLKGTTAVALAGRPVGVTQGTAHAAMLPAFFPAIRVVGFPTAAEMLQALKDGKVEAVFGDGLHLSFWTSAAASQKCCALFDGPYLSERHLGEGMSIMVKQKDKLLLAALDHALLDLSRNGRLEEIYLRYFPHGLY
ncbi:transporter substrate-binding domain-containing protein [Rhizobiaceae bacterium n13]|uniref:Transporter substrate-binding domain-containing protein n=1 Tax=Ferirhizobium litorale TaxID=2927786 RepID=A0AAE3U3J3_9HYPH|nr:transporter substrate-binding domain-containing protein [Fererhizobium litorale]MDI7862273.1 transporter substrate-binding domain-containing protein [Fererhizobium litorale]MDI7922453.1 transporter substrate-binding domain-containing protein [Fererhizobium litorale]